MMTMMMAMGCSHILFCKQSSLLALQGTAAWLSIPILCLLPFFVSDTIHCVFVLSSSNKLLYLPAVGQPGRGKFVVKKCQYQRKMLVQAFRNFLASVSECMAVYFYVGLSSNLKTYVFNKQYQRNIKNPEKYLIHSLFFCFYQHIQYLSLCGGWFFHLCFLLLLFKHWIISELISVFLVEGRNEIFLM